MASLLLARYEDIISKSPRSVSHLLPQDARSIAPNIDRMKSFGVKSILDYSAEEDLSQDQAEDLEMTSCVSEAETDEVKTNFAGLNTPGRDREFKSESP